MFRLGVAFIAVLIPIAAVPGEEAPFQADAEVEIPLTVRVVDALTGDPLPEARWGLVGHAGSVASNRSHPIRTKRVGRHTERLRFEMPAGHVHGDPAWLRLDVSRFTKRVSLDYPARREARVLIRSPLKPDATAQLERLGAQRFGQPTRGEPAGSLRVEPAGDASYRIRGIPFFAGQEVELSLTHTPPDGEARATTLTVPLPRAPDLDVRADVDFGRSRSEGSDDWDGAFGETQQLGPTGQGRARVHIRATDRTGALIPFARITSLANRWTEGEAFKPIEGRTDRNGALRIDDVMAPGRVSFTLSEPGFIPATRVLEIRAGSISAVFLEEPQAGNTLTVRVSTPAGNPAAFATIDFTPPHEARRSEDAEGHQRMTCFTDAKGIVRITGLGTGEAWIRAEWAGWSAATFGTDIQISDASTELALTCRRD